MTFKLVLQILLNDSDDDVADLFFLYRWPAIVERDPSTEEYLEFCRESDLAPV